MNILTQRFPGLPVGLLCMMCGILWLQAALQKAPWVINAQGQRFGWLSNWLWTETQHPTFGFYKAMLEHMVLPHFTFFGYLSFVVELALGVSLFLGLLTVLSGIGGALWQCNIAIGSYPVPSACRPGKLEGPRPMRIVTIIPALDEEAAIGSVVRAISREFVHEVIVVDNGSRDGTAAGGGIYLCQSQRRTLHDKAGPFNDDPFFGFCNAGPCGNFLGADAPIHC